MMNQGIESTLSKNSAESGTSTSGRSSRGRGRHDRSGTESLHSSIGKSSSRPKSVDAKYYAAALAVIFSLTIIVAVVGIVLIIKSKDTGASGSNEESLGQSSCIPYHADE